MSSTIQKKRRVTPSRGVRYLDIALSFSLAALVFVGAAVFLFGPGDALWSQWVTLDRITSAALNRILIGISFAGAAYLFLLRRSLRKVSPEGHNRRAFIKLSPIPTWMKRLYGVVCGIVLVRACFDLNSPLEPDEIEQVAVLLRRFNGGRLLHELFWGGLNHVLPKMLSFASMALFGVGATNARIPSLFFTALFLVAAYRLLKYLPSRYARLLLIGHLAANGLFRLYFASMRGYVAELFFTTALLTCYLDLFSGEVKLTPKRMVIFLVLVGGIAISHNFGIFFVGALAIAFLITTTAYPTAISRASHGTGIGYSLILLAGGPFFAVMFIRLARYLHGVQVIPKLETFNTILLNPFLTVGFSFDWQSKVVLLSFIALFILTREVAKKENPFLRNLLLVMAVGQFAVLEFIPHPTLSSRFFLPFAIVMVIVFAQICRDLRHVKQRQWFQVWGLALFIVLPLVNTGKVLPDRTGPNNDELIGRHFPHWSYCRCSPAPQDLTSCQVEQVTAMKVSYRQSVRRPAGFEKCDDAGCSATFDSKYDELCLYWAKRGP